MWGLTSIRRKSKLIFIFTSNIIFITFFIKKWKKYNFKIKKKTQLCRKFCFILVAQASLKERFRTESNLLFLVQGVEDK